MSGGYWKSVLVALIASLFGALLTSGGVSFQSNTEITNNLPENAPAVFTIVIVIFVIIIFTLAIFTLIVGGSIQLGYAKYLLKEYDRQERGVNDLFSQMDRFGQGFLQMFLRSLFSSLWALLFIIPGIIKSLSYAMTPFIMAENPQMSAKEAIDASKILMDGHKWELFCLGFSFIGWNLLNALTLGIGSLFLNPYKNAAYAAFYRHITTQAEPQI